MSNKASYEQLCDILETNSDITTITQLMKKASSLGFAQSTRNDVCMAMGWIRQFRIVRQPIFVN